MSTVKGYSRAQIALHWLTAILVIAAFVLHEGMVEVAESRLRDGTEAALPLHGWIGLSVLALVILRIALRLTRGAPEPSAGDPPAQRLATIWGHRALYLLLVVVPLGGAGTWFLRMEDSPHGALGYLLMILALGHAVMALIHHYLRRDDVLRRMMRPER